MFPGVRLLDGRKDIGEETSILNCFGHRLWHQRYWQGDISINARLSGLLSSLAVEGAIPAIRGTKRYFHIERQLGSCHASFYLLGLMRWRVGLQPGWYRLAFSVTLLEGILSQR